MELKGESAECDDDALEESMMMDSSDECYSGDHCDDEEPEDGVHSLYTNYFPHIFILY